MELSHITAFSLLVPAYLFWITPKLRRWFLFLVSIVAIYWLQPATNIRWLEYSLPTVTLVITILSWFVLRRNGARLQRTDRTAIGLVLVVMMALLVPRYIDIPVQLTSRPPPIETVLMGISLFGGLGFLLLRIEIPPHILLRGILIACVALFVVTKWEPLTNAVSGILRHHSGQDTKLASAVDIGWLGFSYVVFRLIHTIRDRQSGILPDVSLRDYITYVVFFPAYTAGPIDRLERFSDDLMQIELLNALDVNRITQSSTRIVIGLFKKFIIADSLSVISLNDVLATQAENTLSLWIMLYAFAFRLYFDFSGYSDIAIGLGGLVGIRLPENFDRPYLRNNIAVFWQSWHITLSNWARFYIYSPLSRSLLRRKYNFPVIVIILICQLSTMLVIGLWHGITIPFFVWGLWHGMGLFVHRIWSDRTRKWYRSLNGLQASLWYVSGVVITFHFVLLGWVWFALSDVNAIMVTFARLMGATT